jgi:triosephosphate isomerase
MRERIVAGNWKMHGSRATVREYAAGLGRVTFPEDVRVLLFPPALLLPALAEACEGLPVAFGVQTVHPEAEGAFTGELSAEMAADAGASWSLVGHSERRQYAHEDDVAVAERAAAALRAGLRPVLCVGETLAERRGGDADAVVLRQLAAVCDAVGDDLRRGAIAYEPVWAIGTGETATPEQAQAMHAVIRGALAARGEDWARMPVLYGGSVKPDNAGALFANNDVDGGLVGGASLDAAAFGEIVAAARPAPAGTTSE